MKMWGWVRCQRQWGGQEGVSWIWQGSHTHEVTAGRNWLSESSPVLPSLDPSPCHQTYLLKTKMQSCAVRVEGHMLLLSHIYSLMSGCLLLLSDWIVSSWAQDRFHRCYLRMAYLTRDFHPVPNWFLPCPCLLWGLHGVWMEEGTGL